MRQVTKDEADRWTALAAEHGHVREDGQIALGRYVTVSTEMPTGEEPGRVTVRFVTPAPAPLYSPTLTPKAPPVMFDRLQTDEIVLPGRWWQHTFSKLADDDRIPDDMRRVAMLFATRGEFADTILPADTDTIAFLAPDDADDLVSHEALPPGTNATMSFRLK